MASALQKQNEKLIVLTEKQQQKETQYVYGSNDYVLEILRTGKLCGRSQYFTYMDFDNFCMMEYVNCMEGYREYEVLHMGYCFDNGWRETKYYSRVESFNDYYYTLAIVGYAKNTMFKLPKEHKRLYFKEMARGINYATTKTPWYVWIANLFG